MKPEKRNWRSLALSAAALFIATLVVFQFNLRVSVLIFLLVMALISVFAIVAKVFEGVCKPRD